MKTVHLLIKGKVQGVFYRATAKDIAEKTGVKGWIKNTESGDVEAVVTGTKELVNEFTEWCKKGSTLAKVSEVNITEREAEDFEEFVVIRGKD
jgi:acylphosphatase